MVATFKIRHVTPTTPIMWYSVIPRRTLRFFNPHTKFGDSGFSRSGDMIAGVKIENGSCDLLGAICHL